MAVRKKVKVWGGIFTATVLFVALLTADLTLNQATTASYIYGTTQVSKIVPVEILACMVLSIPVIAIVSGVQFLRYFLKSRKTTKAEPESAVTA